MLIQIVEDSRGERLVLEYGTIEEFMNKSRDSEDYAFLTLRL